MIANFKKMTDEQLRDFWFKYHRAGWQTAEKVLGRRKVNGLHALANYAINLVAFRSCKARKDKNGIAVYKHSCRLCFDTVVEEGVNITSFGWEV